MNRRIKKKRWKEQTNARQADLLERVAALEDLTLLMSHEQTQHWEQLIRVRDSLDNYKAAQKQRQEREAKYRARRERIRLEREAERRRFRRGWAKCAAMLAVAVSFLMFALMLPSPERIEPVSTAEPMAVAADPAEGVVEAVVLSWEG